MLENAQTNDKLVFSDLSEEEKQKRGILGRLYGPCADIIHSTRNGRKYSDKLWEKVFQMPLVQELFKNGGIPGEIDHPTDRSETDSSRIAIMMPEKPKKGKDGKLMAYFDILNTPCGQIAYQLAKYGFKWGVSSRGEGDIIEDYATGEDSVDPDTYTLNAFDLVLIPSVEQARLDMITESLDNTKRVAFKKSINESLEKASAGDKKIMEDTLKDLHIDYLEKQLVENVKTHNSVDNKKVKIDSQTAGNVGVDEAIKSLQESLKQTQNLQNQVKSLQEKLSVCNAKEVKLKESLQRSATDYKELKEKFDKVSVELQSTKDGLCETKSKLEESLKTVDAQNRRIDLLSKRCEVTINSKKELTESVSSKDETIRELNEKLKSNKESFETKITRLSESLNEAKQNLAVKDKELKVKVERATKLAEGYHKLANEAVDKYIEVRAMGIGISKKELKEKLGDNYSLEDIDKICDSISESQMSVSNLPFEFKRPCRVTVKESKEPMLPKSTLDDDIDNQLMSLAGSFIKRG